MKRAGVQSSCLSPRLPVPQFPRPLLLHPSSFRLHPFLRLARGEAFEARATQAALVARAEFGARLLTQFNLTTPAARERRAADEVRAARLARRRLAQ